MPTKRVLLIIVVVSVVVLVVGAGSQTAGIVRAAPPEPSPGSSGATIPYSGRLTDQAGRQVADGLYAFTFTAYNAETGGQPLWSEVQTGVQVTQGGFATALGRAQPIPAGLSSARSLWLVISVRGPGETAFTTLSPRQGVSVASAAAPAGAAVSAACPHNHLGEIWNGNYSWSSAAFRVNNSASGPSIWGWNSGGGNGLRGDSWGGGIGVYGEGENGPGIAGRSQAGNGLEGSSTNGYGLFAHSDNNHSIYVDGAGLHGVYVESAGWDGVAVWSAATAGMYVHSAGADGILVDTANWDGVHVVGPVGGAYYGSGKKGDEDFAVLNTGEVRSKVGFAAPTHGFAENMAVEGALAGYEPGDVLVAATTGKGAVALSSVAYSPAVIGVYAASPAVVGGQAVVTGQQAGGVPVTILGMVLCKVSAENGPISPGDLLVTSATPGHAMRADQAPQGTVLGKALEALASGTGVILVLVTLQ